MPGRERSARRRPEHGPPRELLLVRLADAVPTAEPIQGAQPGRHRMGRLVLVAVAGLALPAVVLARGDGLPARPQVHRLQLVDSFADRAALDRGLSHLVVRLRNPGSAVRLEPALVRGVGLQVEGVDGPDQIGRGGTATLLVQLGPDCAGSAEPGTVRLDLRYVGPGQRVERLTAKLPAPAEFGLSSRCDPLPPPPAQLQVELDSDDGQEGRVVVRATVTAVQALTWSGLTGPGAVLRSSQLPVEVPAGGSATVRAELSLLSCEPVPTGFGDLMAALVPTAVSSVTAVSAEPEGDYADAVTKMIRECNNG